MQAAYKARCEHHGTASLSRRARPDAALAVIALHARNLNCRIVEVRDSCRKYGDKYESFAPGASPEKKAGRRARTAVQSRSCQLSQRRSREGRTVTNVAVFGLRKHFLAWMVGLN